MLRIAFALILSLISATPAWAAVKSKNIDYKYNGKTFKGYLAWDDSIQGKRPGVLVVHEVWGLNDYARSRADQLAKLGYVAFAADMWGDGKVSSSMEEAQAWMTELRNNLPEWLGRANAAIKVLSEQPTVDPTKLAAMGYCFGGGTVLQLAFNGADLKLVASFHGALVVPDSTQNIKGKILILQGADDPFIPKETVQQVKAKLDQGKVNYQLILYPGAVHGFTVPGSEKRGMKGVAYNAEADQQSWQELLSAFDQVFGKKS